MGNNPAASPILSLGNIRKSFSAVQVLSGVDLELQAGQVHALVGENGAGKSTLLKIVAGIWPHSDYEGQYLMEGRPAVFSALRQAQESGIHIVNQELALVPEMTVAENITLGAERSAWGIVDKEDADKRAGELLQKLGLNVDPRARLKDLGIGVQQAIEIAKGLSRDFKVLILDEPTAALSESESRALMQIIRNLKEKGVGILYVSHRLKEVLEISDIITVLRDGKSVACIDAAEATEDKLVSLMIGRESGFSPAARTARDSGEDILKVKDLLPLGRPGDDKEARYRAAGLGSVSFSLKKGEILGVAGLVGAGRSELLQTLYGVRKNSGDYSVEFEGHAIQIGSPAEALSRGIVLIPEDRKTDGLMLEESVVFNSSLMVLDRFSRMGAVDFDRERELAAGAVRQYRVKCPSLESPVGNLSGGNQQKVLIARNLLTGPKVVMLDEPGRGIDVAAKFEIHEVVRGLAASGAAVILVSSELLELFSLADRIMVLSDGFVSGELAQSDFSEERAMQLMTKAFTLR